MKKILLLLVLCSSATFAQTTISTQEVRTVRLQLLCDKCGGEMVLSPWVLTSLPPQYQYSCPKCLTGCSKFEIFPRTEVIPITSPPKLLYWTNLYSFTNTTPYQTNIIIFTLPTSNHIIITR